MMLLVCKCTVLMVMSAVINITRGAGCIQHEYCDDAFEISKSILAYPDNFEQLIKAFYPINQAEPSSIIIVYFTNYTNMFPQECSKGTYPWKTYPVINSNSSIAWYYWTTTPMYMVGMEMYLIEFGEYLPIESYYLAFNVTSPFYLPTQLACIKTPFDLGDVMVSIYRRTAIDVTIQVHIYIYSRY